jgi:glucokinase
MLILAADIGGTNARLALISRGSILFKKVYPSAEFDSIEPVISDFLRHTDERVIDAAAIAAAGVVEDGGSSIKGLNLAWTIRRDQVAGIIGTDRCLLLNDFEAAAWGLFTLEGPTDGPGKGSDLIQIGGPKPEPSGPKALLGAGTGLGEATVVPCDEGGLWTVLRSEGGHCSFAPTDSRQMELLQFLSRRYGHVSFERVVSGEGLMSIYEFITSNHLHTQGARITGPKQVAEAARAGDAAARVAMELFFTIFASEAANLALKSIPAGGTYMAGGIIAKNLDLLPRQEMLKAFCSKGRMEGLLKEIPLLVVATEALGLKGAAYRAELLFS